MFYAIEWREAGAYTREDTRWGTYHHFEKKVDRDDWVRDGAASRFVPFDGPLRFRERILASDPEIRSLRRKGQLP